MSIFASLGVRYNHRVMWLHSVSVLTPQGVQWVELAGDERSIAAQHINAATHYRDTGSTERLEAFRGLVLGGHELETDPDQIEFLAAQGQLDFEDFYESE